MASTVEDTKLKALTYQDRDDIAPWLENLLYDRGPAEGISKSTIKPRTKPRQQFYKGNWMPSQKSAMIAEGIKHVLRDAGVPDSKVAVVATRIQNVFRDIASPAVSTQRMYEISRQVFKVEFAKAFGVVGSPFGMSESVETNVSSDHMEDRDEDKQKTYRNGKKMKIETYREKGYRDGPRKAQNLKQQYGMDWAYKPTSETSMNGNRLRGSSASRGGSIWARNIEKEIGPVGRDPESEIEPTSRNVSGDWINDRERRKETYRENVIGATGAQRNSDGTTESNVSNDRDEKKAYPETSRHKKDNREWPRKDQEPERQYGLNWGNKPRNQKPQRQYESDRAYKPANEMNNRRNRQYGSFASQSGVRNDKEEIGPAGHDLETETRTAKENVSIDLENWKAYLENSRLQNRPELRGKLGTHRARKPDGGLKIERRIIRKTLTLLR